MGSLSISTDTSQYMKTLKKYGETLKKYWKDFEICNFWNILKDNGKTKKNCGQVFDKFWKYCRKHHRNFEDVSLNINEICG